MTVSSLDKKFALGSVIFVISLIVANVITNFNWIDFGYLVFVGSCIIRYLYIAKNE